MDLTNHLFGAYDTFYSYRVYFSSVMSLTTMGLGLVPLVRELFHFVLTILLVVSVE